jgi:cytochrome c-type biogenesis protein CcsB
MRAEQLLFWSAVVLYGVSAFAYIFGVMARSERLLLGGQLTAIAGLAAHVVAIGVRWATQDVNPFISITESISLGMVASVLLFVIVERVSPKMRPLGVLVMPVAFAMMGWAGALRTAPSAELAPALQSAWIWIHIIGASIGFSAVLVAAALGLVYLLKEAKDGGIYEKLPPLAVLDQLSYRFVVGGFALYGVMIVSGAFWANQVKGLFWNWDPVEIWSLVSWLIYGIYLHLHATFGWRGKRMAVYSLVAAAAMIISFWGIPFSVETFHKGFRIEH